ncbi:Tat pathway signal protein [Dysgonomonas sp. 216]|uniref:Tat pathway signal protein n=1 Tax=Dysgonomonas sp. 216 TaxID=2302934 RepID=UPI0013D08A8F|nr:Tat pathway signal protein [Dysgonomonas sp. 216]NDW17747.1 Tat pathway signal protein [Dysgonomonas sp. 216]
MKKTLILFLCISVNFFNLQSQNTLIDVITFGNQKSEAEHSFSGKQTHIKENAALGQSARITERMPDNHEKGGDLTFTIKVDPTYQNYLTVKFWGSDTCSVLNKVFIDGKQIGYNRTADYGPFNNSYSDALPDRFYYVTTLLPFNMTKGKEKVELTITSEGKQVNRQVYKGYVHTNPYIDFSNEKQGTKHIDLENIVAKGLSENDKNTLLAQYREKQIEDFNKFSKKLDDDPLAKISIVKYQDELRYYALSLLEPWCPAQTNEEKKKVLFRIFQVIDNYVIDYYKDYRLVTRGGHQGDWGGYLGALGEALYIVENYINDDNVLGQSEFNKFLDQQFKTNTKESKYSLPEADWAGKTLTRRSAWERAFKANYDFARARLSYIYNQVYYTYDGAWKSHEGFRIINSDFYEGKERSHQILKEALGMGPFLGEEVLVAPDGRELNLFHSLFYHDREAFFTDDFIFIVAKGLAKSKLDKDGNIVRRLPYGKHYYGISETGLTKENGYVGNYGETPNYLSEWFYRTLNHKGDEEMNDEILKLALLNVHARGFARYTSTDENNKRIMRMQQVVDNRNSGYPGMYAYAIRVSTNKMLHFASLEKHMVENEKRYSSPEWNKYWKYAAEIVGFAQQQLLDNQYFPGSIEKGRANALLNLRKYDYVLPETYKYLTSGRSAFTRFKNVQAGYIHPLTNFNYYTDNELKQLHVDKKDYEQLAWADIDCMMAVVRDGDNVLTGVFNFQNRAFSGVGKIHVQKKNYDHIVHLATKAKFIYNDYYLRMNSTYMDFIANVNDVYTYSPQALAGEICPITYQPGVGKVVRENFEVDHPYSAFPDYLEAQYGEYLFVFNTTRKQYGNEQTYEVELPKEYKKGKILDLISGKQLNVKKNKVTVSPNSALVLKLNKDSYFDFTPYPVDFVTALHGNNKVALSWKPAHGATSYTVKRAFAEDGKYETIAENIQTEYFEDSDITNGTLAFYKIVPVNNYGKSWDSYRAKANLTKPTINDAKWREDAIGNISTGKAEINDSKILIHDTDGYGLGEGDDYMIETRDIEDSFMFVHTIANGDVEFSAKITPRRALMHGIMFRDQLTANTRYIFLGTNQFGQIVFQSRTRDTRHEFHSYKLSPYNVSLPGHIINEYPYIKLKRNAKDHIITGYISKDGTNWQSVGELFTPFPMAIYIGVSAAGAQKAEFDNIEAIFN